MQSLSARIKRVAGSHSAAYSINSSAAASNADGAVRPSALAVIAAKCNASGFCRYDNLFRNNLSHGILAVAQTKEAFASNLKRWVDLR